LAKPRGQRIDQCLTVLEQPRTNPLCVDVDDRLPQVRLQLPIVLERVLLEQGDDLVPELGSELLSVPDRSPIVVEEE